MHVSVFHDLQNRGADQIDRLESKPKKENMKSKMTDISNRWKNIKRSMTDRRREMDRLLPVVICYVQTRNQFITWLTQDERTITELALGAEISDVETLFQKKDIIKVRYVQENNPV